MRAGPPTRRGRLVVITGPSGVGKGTVVRSLLAERPEMAFSVSATTRAPRPGERDGVQYRFLSDEEFDSLIAADAFLEWAEIFGYRYGTPAAPVEEVLSAGRDVILEIDVQGARRVRSKVPEAILVFLRPPSEGELARRLEERGTEAAADLERRLTEARSELAEAGWFDHQVVNDRVERAAAEVLAIIDGNPSRQGDPS